MECLSQETKKELAKIRYHLITLDGADTGETFHTRSAAEKMQSIRWDRQGIALQIIAKGGK